MRVPKSALEGSSSWATCRHDDKEIVKNTEGMSSVGRWLALYLLGIIPPSMCIDGEDVKLMGLLEKVSQPRSETAPMR